MEGTIDLILNNQSLARVSAAKNPKLFLDLIAASRTGDISEARLVTPVASAKRSHIRSATTSSDTSTKAPAPQRPRAASVGTTRSQAARDQLDQQLFNALKGDDWTRLEKAQLHSSFTSAQLRESARRLVAAGRLQRRGQARATEYKAVLGPKSARPSVLRERKAR